jgi:hypothetical protein
MEVLKVEMKKVENEVLQLSIKEQLREAYQASNEDLEYVEKEFSSFCKNQQLKKALLNSVDLLNSGDFESIRGLIDNALKAGAEKNIGHEYIKDTEARYREEARTIVPTPWEDLMTLCREVWATEILVLYLVILEEVSRGLWLRLVGMP